MKIALFAIFQLVVIVALVSGAAVSDETLSRTNALEGAQRDGRVLFEDLGNKLALKKLKIDQHLEKIKDFALTNKELIGWSVLAAAVAAAIVWIVSLFTGLDGLVKSVAYKMDSVKSRADDMGLKLDADHLNFLTHRVFEAIDSWGRKHE